MGAFIRYGDTGVWASNGERNAFLDWYAENRCLPHDPKWEYCKSEGNRWMGCGIELEQLIPHGEVLEVTNSECRAARTKFGPDMDALLAIISQITRGDWPHLISSKEAINWRPPPEMSLEVQHLCKDYPTRSGSLPILRDLNLRLERGEALAVMGPSGSGKSTLLHILGTLDSPTSGSVYLNDKDPFSLSEPELADFRNRAIGFVFQDHHLLPQCSVLENVLIPTLVGNHKTSDVEAWARELLDRVGLSGRLEHRPAELSGGEKQRVALARALIHRPSLLLADEPTGNLDRRSAQVVGQLLLELHRQEQTILVVVTHSQELAKSFPQRMEMIDGRLEVDPACRAGLSPVRQTGPTGAEEAS